ncbi:hypothetical protein RHGRI_005327 [Rhododendron griersonianum]|uniref:Tocopherol cyclase n=1 Tax=Rhododendron griersonianum TaxID=479676 RepID=A0AAV6LEB9_9ERIC|nr:hypothetical protein RHGRI_005327 [Rhododendron griersonianum]
METNVYSIFNTSPCEPHLPPMQLGLRGAFPCSRAANGVDTVNLAQFRNPTSFRAVKKLRCRSRGRAFAIAESVSSSTADKPEPETETAAVESASPVYVPTPPNRDLRTPHSGYHFDGTTRKFFEGWYFKVSIPERRQSFCFMYSVENPAFRKKMSRLEEAQYGPRFTGVGAQILGADDKYICQYNDESQNFWGSRHELALGSTFVAQKDLQPPNKEVPPEEFNRRVLEGFQVTPLWNQGFICDDGRTDYVDIVKTARWEYSTRPIYGWGNVGSKQKSTAGWLAAFPVFEPHWQICMAGGLSTGNCYFLLIYNICYFLLCSMSCYECYYSKWIPKGLGFQFCIEILICLAVPSPDFQEVQCNVFEGASGEVALTAAGGLRQLPGITETYENAALIGIHYEGTFYEFVPWNGVVNFEVAPWGHWCMSAENETHKVELEATTEDPGTTLRAPTSEGGLAPACKDTCFGDLRLQLWERRYDGSKGKLILDVTSNMAAVEVGGGPWFSTWKGKTSSPELVNRALNLPIDMEGIYGLVPLFKPPGL